MNFLRRLFGARTVEPPTLRPLATTLKIPPTAFSEPRRAALTARSSTTVTLAESDADDLFDIVGESFYQDALEDIAGPKTPEGADEEVDVILRPEPHNPYDRNAVAVYAEGKKVGHLSRDHNQEFLTFLAQAGATEASCIGYVEGGWKNSRTEGSYCVRLDIEWPPRLAD